MLDIDSLLSPESAWEKAASKVGVLRSILGAVRNWRESRKLREEKRMQDLEEELEELVCGYRKELAKYDEETFQRLLDLPEVQLASEPEGSILSELAEGPYLVGLFSCMTIGLVLAEWLKLPMAAGIALMALLTVFGARFIVYPYYKRQQAEQLEYLALKIALGEVYPRGHGKEEAKDFV